MELQRLFHASQAVYILLHGCGTVGLDIHISSTEHYVGSTIHNLLDTQTTRLRKPRQDSRTRKYSTLLSNLVFRTDQETRVYYTDCFMTL